MSDNEPKHGGPVHPVPGHDWPGLSLRDYFAGQALVGICTRAAYDYTSGPCNAAIVERAWLIADLMLKARGE